MTHLNLNDLPAVVKQVQRNTQDIETLFTYRDSCDGMHKQHKERSQQHSDVVSELTKSTLSLSESIRTMSASITTFITKLDEVTKKVEQGQPVINFWTRMGIAFGVSKEFAKGVVAIAVGVGAIASVYNIFF